MNYFPEFWEDQIFYRMRESIIDDIDTQLLMQMIDEQKNKGLKMSEHYPENEAEAIEFEKRNLKQLKLEFQKEFESLHRPLTEASPDSLIDEALPDDKIIRTKRLAGLLPEGSVIDLPVKSYDSGAARMAELSGTPLTDPKFATPLALEEAARLKRAIVNSEVLDSKEMSKVVAEYDSVSKPKHYNAPNGMQAIDVIEGFNLSFAVGNAVKYLLRGNVKHETPKEDYLKVLWYVSHELKRLGFQDDVLKFFEKQLKNPTI